MRHARHSMQARTLACAAVGVVALLAAGCQSGDPTRAASNRPMVEVTAADLFSWGQGSASQQLEFYDELERRPIVSQDDAVHAVLLLNGGPSATTYQGRLAAAKARGLLDSGYAPPAREAVTVGEVSQMLARAMRLGPSGSTADATATMKREGLIPEQADQAQGLTGAQMLAVLASARDVMAAAGNEVRPPAASTTVAAARPEPAVTAPVKSASNSPAPAPEPLPEPAPAVAKAAPAQPPPPPAPKPVAAAAPVATAAPAPSPSPMPARVEIVGAPMPMSEAIPELSPVRRPRAETRPVAAASRPGDDLADALLGPGPLTGSNSTTSTTPPRAQPTAAAPAVATPAEPAPVTIPAAAPTVGTPKPGPWVPGKPLRKPIRPGSSGAAATPTP